MVESKNAKDELVSLLKKDIDSSKISLAKVKSIDGNNIYVSYPVGDFTELNELKSERLQIGFLSTLMMESLQCLK